MPFLSISDRVNNAIITGMGLEPQDRPQTVWEWLELVENLKTARMDYTRLRNLLTAGKWKEADEETARVMLAVAGRKKEGWLDNPHIDNFPCEDLRIIDQLWMKYSNGRFGFSVQKRIYQSLGGTREYNEKIWIAFCNRIGWRENNSWMYYDDLTFNLTAPKAHLPTFPDSTPFDFLVNSLGGWSGSIFMRFKSLGSCILIRGRDL